MADGQVTIKAILDASGVKSGVREVNSAVDGIHTSGMDNLGSSSTKAGAAARGAGTDLGGTVNTAANLGTSMTLAGQSLKSGITDPLVEMGKTAIDVAGEFGQTMNMVQAMSGASEQEMEQLRQKAIQVGADTKFSANESAYAILELSKAGMKNDQILGGVLDSTMKLATIGELPLADAATVATNAMNSFHLEADDTESIVVALAGAANASTADVASLAEGLGNCSSVANAVGWDINDVCGALALFEDNGIHGAEAGTQLKSMLMKLMKPTDDAAAVMEQYGIEIYDSNGKMKSFAEISQILKDKLSGLTDEERNFALGQIFGTYAIQGANIAYSSSAEAIDGYKDATYDAEAAQKMMEAAMSDIPGALERMNGGIETVMMALGEKMAPVIIGAADFVNTLCDAFLSLPDGVQVAIVVIGAIVAAIGPLLMIGGALLSIIAGAITALPVVSAAAGGLLAAIGPVVGVVAAIIAVVVALAMWIKNLWDTNEEFRAHVTELVASISEKAQALWQTLQTVGQGIIDAATNVWNAVRPVLEAAQNFIGEIIMQAIIGLLEFIDGTVMPDIQAFMDFVGPLIDEFCSWFDENLGPVVKEVLDGIVRALESLKQNVSLIMSSIRQTVEGVWNIIKGIVMTIVGLIVGIVTGDFSMMWEGVRTIFSGVQGTISGILGTVVSVVGAKVEAILQFLGFKGLANTVHNVFENARKFIENPIEAAKTFVGNAVGAIERFFSGMRIELPQIKLPHFSVSGGFNLDPFNFQVPSISVDWYGKGAVFNSASIIGIGEAGREAALPLNTRTYQEIADGISTKLTGGQGDVTVMVKIDRFVNEREEDIDMLIERIERKVKRDLENAL